MADGVTLEGDLKSELTCLVCLSIYDRPYRLDCEHAFCWKCLQQLVKSDSSTVSCPACRTQTYLRFPGFLGIAKLPADLRLSRLVETYISKVGRDEDELEEEKEAAAAAASYEPAVEEVIPFEHINVSQCSEVIHEYIPFDLSIERTQEMFRSWKKNLWLCPTDFPDKAVLMNVRMVSVPFYVFNVRTQVDFKATVFCPQDNRATLPPCETTTDTKRSRIESIKEAGNSHPSRRWIQQAIGSTVTIKTSRDKSKNPDLHSWGTWLWTAAKPLISSVVSSASSGGCSTGIPGQAPCSTSCEASLEKENSIQQEQNMEMKAKVGQTYVSSTQPMQRQLQFSGRHGNEFTNMLVCATFAMDHDLVAALMTGQSKDHDLSLLTPIKIPPPTASNNSEYLDKILKLVKSSEGVLWCNDKETSSSHRSKKKKDKKSKKEGDKKESDRKEKDKKATSSSQAVRPNQVTYDPAVVYDELLSTPAACKQSDEMDGFSTFMASSSEVPPALSAPQPTQQLMDESINEFFEDVSHPPAPHPVFTDAVLPSSLSSSVYIPPANGNVGSIEDDGDFEGIPSPANPPPASGRVFSAALEKEDYFAPADIPSSTPIPESAHTTFHEAEIIPPERKSEDAWVEQIWPHVQEKEIEFTKSILKSLEPKGAVVDSSELELTVTDLKQKYVLFLMFR